VLGPYYRRLLAKEDLRARQCSPRGGDLLLHVKDDSVLVTGRAALALRGEIVLPSK
jgi:hypothetical protein